MWQERPMRTVYRLSHAHRPKYKSNDADGQCAGSKHCPQQPTAILLALKRLFGQLLVKSGYLFGNTCINHPDLAVKMLIDFLYTITQIIQPI